MREITNRQKVSRHMGDLSLTHAYHCIKVVNKRKQETIHYKVGGSIPNREVPIVPSYPDGRSERFRQRKRNPLPEKENEKKRGKKITNREGGRGRPAEGRWRPAPGQEEEAVAGSPILFETEVRQLNFFAIFK